MYRLVAGWLDVMAKPNFNGYLIKRALMSTTTQVTGQNTEKLTGTSPVKSSEEDIGQKFEKQKAANPDQLTYIADKLERHAPKFFVEPHPFNLYTDNMCFINNITTKKIYGLQQYAFHLALLKLYYHTRYASLKVELLNLVKHPEESCVKLRWRIVAKPGLLRFIFNFWKYHSEYLSIDAISTMHVNHEGKIYCHICDNIDLETGDLKEGVESKIKKVVKSRLVNRDVNV